MVNNYRTTDNVLLVITTINQMHINKYIRLDMRPVYLDSVVGSVCVVDVLSR